MYSTPTLTALTLLRFNGLDRLWMLSQMAFARPALRQTPGLRFWKLLGSGVNFGLRPDFNRFALLTVWQSADQAAAFFSSQSGDRSPGSVLHRLQQRAVESWTVHMLPLRVRGTWAGATPFVPLPHSAAEHTDGPLAVLTRATIRLGRLRAFWSRVPATQRALQGAPGLLLSIGIGEAPIVRQATFSLWRSEAAMRAYAYQLPAHAEVIRRTRDESWYAEELFARFVPIASQGTWDGRDPLRGE